MKRVPLFKFTTLLILVMLLLQGCAASTLPSNYFQPADWQALTVSARGVAWGIQQASLDKPGTQVMTILNTQKYAILWFADYGASIFAVDIGNKMTGQGVIDAMKQGGTLVNTKSAQALIQTLKDNGWTAIPGSQLPKLIKDIVAKGNFEPWMKAAPDSALISLFGFLPNIGPGYCGTEYMTDLMQSVLCDSAPDNKS